MARVPSRYGTSVSFGPGPLSQAMKGLIGANVAVFVLNLLLEAAGVNAGWYFSLRPDAVVQQYNVWQLATYMFLHGGVFHLLFNMLALWMFGTELERVWGTRYFVKFYFLTGIGAGVLTVLVSLLPFGFAASLFHSNIVGASGAIYGLLLAYGLTFPNRPIYIYFIFAIPAKYFVMIMGALAFYSSLSDNNGVANATHLGGLLVGYLLLKGARVDPIGELRYRYLRWKMGRGRRKFEVYSGGRSDDWNRRIH